VLKLYNFITLHYGNNGRKCTSSDENKNLKVLCYELNQCFSIAGPRPGTGPWHQFTGPLEACGNYSKLQDFISPVDK